MLNLTFHTRVSRVSPFVFERLSECVSYALRTASVLGAFAKLRQTTVAFVMSVRSEQLGHNWADFHEILFDDFYKFEFNYLTS